MRVRSHSRCEAGESEARESEKHAWDVSWTSNVAELRDFTFLGVLKVHSSRVRFSSRMLGFLACVEVVLPQVASVTLEGSAGVLVSKEGERVSFQCVTGASDTEACVALLREFCSVTPIVR